MKPPILRAASSVRVGLAIRARQALFMRGSPRLRGLLDLADADDGGCVGLLPALGVGALSEAFGWITPDEEGGGMAARQLVPADCLFIFMPWQGGVVLASVD